MTSEGSAGWLFSDQCLTALSGVAIVAVALAVAFGSVARTRSAGLAGSVASVFWADVGTVAWVWAAGTGVTTAGSIVGVEGLRTPLWLLIELVVGAALVAVTAYRWRREELGTASRARPVTPLGTTPRRLESTTWEIGLLGGAIAFIGGYLLTMAHGWGHPIHWVVAGIAALLGYAIGIGFATPRYTLGRLR